MELSELAKINQMICDCEDLLSGKYILAFKKISNILNAINDTTTLYGYMAEKLNHFDFQREYSHAQLRSNNGNKKFSLPTDEEKIIPFVFCLLVYFNNHEINLDNFVMEYFSNGELDYGDAFKRFANEIILPFKTLIEQKFDVKKGEIMENQNEFETNENEEIIEETAEELEEETPESYAEITEDKIEKFFAETQANCGQILTELPYEKRLKEELREDIEYLAKAIQDNCDNQDLTNTIALVTALCYMCQKTRNIKFYTTEMKNLIISLYE